MKVTSVHGIKSSGCIFTNMYTHVMQCAYRSTGTRRSHLK